MKFALLLIGLMTQPASSFAEEPAPLADIALIGAGAGAVIYDRAANAPELKRLKEKKAKNDLALKKAKPENMAKFAELEQLQKEADAFMYRDREVLDSKKYLADLELAMSDPKNAIGKDGLNLDHLNETIRLRNKVEPAAMDRWAAANPEKAARYATLFEELDGAEHLGHRVALGDSLKKKIAVRRGIRAISALGIGYVAYHVVDHLSGDPAEISSQSFTRKQTSYTGGPDEERADTFMSFGAALGPHSASNY